MFEFIRLITSAVRPALRRVELHSTIERQPAVEVQPRAQSAVGLAPCNPDSVPQRWVVDNHAHRVKLQGTHLCLALSAEDGSTLELQPCVGNSNESQEWLVVGPAGSSTLVATATSHCAAMVGMPSLLDSQPHWLGVVATRCLPAAAQSWLVLKDA